MRELKITRTNYEKMVDVFKNGLSEICFSNSGLLENYFRLKVEDDYIIDWYWSSQTPNTYFVDEDITVYHISDYNVNCSIDCCIDDCSYEIVKAFKEKYKDDEDALNSDSKCQDFREEYYKENLEDGIIDFCVDCGVEKLEYNLFEDTDIDFGLEIIED